jgi:hypothetical protein
MKKIALAAAGIVLLAAIVWSGLWFVGRGQVAERIDAEISLLAARGFQVTHGGREIGGFPFGYRVSHRGVTLREPVGGGIYRFPEITAEVTAADIDRLVIRLPAKFSMEIPLPEAPDAAPDAATPASRTTMVFDVEANDLMVVTDGWPGSSQDGSITARSLLIASGSTDQPPVVAVEITGFDSQIKDFSAVPTSATKIKRLDYAYAGTAPSGAPFTLEGQIDKLVLTARIAAADGTEPAGGPGNANMTYQTGAAKAAIRAVAGEPEPQGGTLIFSAGSTAGTAAIADGMVEVATSSRANTMMLLPEPMPESTEAKGFGAALRSVEVIYKSPIAPSEAMAPFSLRFALDEVALDTALWGLLDATGALPHDPARLVAEIDGTGRITKGMAETLPGEAMPLEFGNVLVRALDLTAMGASVTTRGELEFLQPINLPQGNLTVKLNGIMLLISKLAETGLLDPELLQTIGVLAALYSAPVGTEPDERVSEIAMTLDGITVNGLALGPGR